MNPHLFYAFLLATALAACGKLSRQSAPPSEIEMVDGASDSFENSPYYIKPKDEPSNTVIMGSREAVDPKTGVITKRVNYIWTLCSFTKNDINGRPCKWTFQSVETAYLEKPGKTQPWIFKDLVHDTILVNGTVPLGYRASANLAAVIKNFGDYGQDKRTVITKVAFVAVLRDNMSMDPTTHIYFEKDSPSWVAQ